MDDQHSLTLDDRARASNAGRLDVQPLVFARSFPRWPALFLVAFILLAAGAMLWHWLLWAAVFPLLLQGWLAWSRVEEHFLYGCVNPGRVVSLHPFRIAVYTDLRRGWKPFPADQGARPAPAPAAGGGPVGRRPGSDGGTVL